MSTESGSEVLTGRLDYDDLDIVHTYCSNSPKNTGVVTVLCCGNPPRGPRHPDDAPVTCPMCADLSEEDTLTCACWW